MKRFLKNKKGVSLLEGLIALMLLALVATGTFGVLLSTSRKSSQPDIREEMAFAVERAMNKLQVYVGATATGATLPGDVQNGLCGGDDIATADKVNDATPLAAGEHNIKCMLPPICDKTADSAFKYKVTASDFSAKAAGLVPTKDQGESVALDSPQNITFDIKCNGFKL